jgi:shikimate kinase
MTGNNIILIGYRGSGKTSVGKALAGELWKTFVDVDDAACRRFGNDSIADIWQKHGEPEWRRVEIEITRELCGRKDHVIGLGGGTLMQPAAREAVESAPGAVRIYLKCDPAELHRRISGDAQSAHTRPHLTAHGGGLDEIKAVLALRGPVYEAVADKTLDVTRMSVADAVRHLIATCL